jgi:hypothetical protein
MRRGNAQLRSNTAARSKRSSSAELHAESTVRFRGIGGLTLLGFFHVLVARESIGGPRARTHGVSCLIMAVSHMRCRRRPRLRH